MLIEVNGCWAIAIDTSIFEQFGYNFESSLLSVLRQFKGTPIKVIIPEVVANEVIHHIGRDLKDSREKAISSFKRAQRCFRGRMLNNVPELGQEFPTISDTEIASSIFMAFVNDIGGEILPLEKIGSLRDLFSDYFSSRPPFSNREEKKAEFPDAFALASIKHWAYINEATVLLVSRDDDWINYCQDFKHIIPYKELSLAISHFVPIKVAHEFCETLTKSIEIVGNPTSKAIRTAVQDYLDNLSIRAEWDSYYSVDEEEICATLKSFIYEPLTTGSTFIPLEIADDYITVSLEIQVSVNVRGVFSIAKYDTEDREYINLPGAIVEVEESFHANVLLKFPILQNCYQLSPLSAEITSDFSHVEFGGIEPDWDENL